MDGDNSPKPKKSKQPNKEPENSNYSVVKFTSEEILAREQLDPNIEDLEAIKKYWVTCFNIRKSEICALKNNPQKLDAIFTNWPLFLHENGSTLVSTI